MKKEYFYIILLLASTLCLCSKVHSQVYGSIQYGTQGAGFAAGYLHSSRIEAQAGYHKPIASSTIPTSFYGAIGYQINLSSKQKGWVLTPSAGIGNNNYVDALDDDGKTINKTLPYYGLQFGKQIHAGRLFASMHYSNQLYVGAGIRAFILTNKK